MSLGESRENGQEAEELVLLSLKKRKLGVEGTPGEGSEEGNDLFSMPTVRRARSGGLEWALGKRPCLRLQQSTAVCLRKPRGPHP